MLKKTMALMITGIIYSISINSNATELNFEVKSNIEILVDKSNELSDEEIEQKKEATRKYQISRSYDVSLQTHNYEKIKNYIANGTSINQKTFDANTIVNLAIMRNDIQLLEIAIANKVNYTNQNKNGENILMQASLIRKNDLLKVIKENIDKKSWDILLGQLSKTQRNPLHYVSLGEGNLENTKILVKEKININQVDSNNQTPLHYAIILGHFEITKLLLENGANIQLKDDNEISGEEYIFSKFNLFQQKELVKYFSKDGQLKVKKLPILPLLNN